MKIASKHVQSNSSRVLNSGTRKTRKGKKTILKRCVSKLRRSLFCTTKRRILSSISMSSLASSINGATDGNAFCSSLFCEVSHFPNYKPKFKKIRKQPGCLCQSHSQGLVRATRVRAWKADHLAAQGLQKSAIRHARARQAHNSNGGERTNLAGTKSNSFS